MIAHCPVCFADNGSVFFHWEDTVAQQQFLLKTRREALQCKKGNIELAFCGRCGTIWNTVFDPKLLEYAAPYEASQMLSPAFQRHATDVAQYVINKFDMRGKDVIDIGCGDAYFLKLLSQFGNNRGVGFDPSWRAEKGKELPDNVRVIADYYSARYANYHADLICSRHMLEHIHDPTQFLLDLARTSEKHRPLFIFEVPNASWSLRNQAFWDIYYEHCLYFSRPSLNHLFASCDFDVLDIREEFGDQYLWVESILKPAQGENHDRLDGAREISELSRDVEAFSLYYLKALEIHRRTIRELLKNGKVVIWGEGARAVAFLNLLDIQLNQIEYVVDINPRKWGAFVPGTGQEIVGPHFLLQYHPDIILVMNPIYVREINQTATDMGISGKTQVVQTNAGETHDRTE